MRSAACSLPLRHGATEATISNESSCVMMKEEEEEAGVARGGGQHAGLSSAPRSSRALSISHAATVTDCERNIQPAAQHFFLLNGHTRFDQPPGA